MALKEIIKAAIAEKEPLGVDNPSIFDLPITALRDAICDRILEVQKNVYEQLLDADETVAQSITLDTGGRTLLDIYAKAAATTTFRLDCSNDNTNWITDYLTWANVTEVKETYNNAFRYIKLKSDAAGAAGDKVSLYLTAAR